jgi:hypothetical protein
LLAESPQMLCKIGHFCNYEQNVNIFKIRNKNTKLALDVTESRYSVSNGVSVSWSLYVV